MLNIHWLFTSNNVLLLSVCALKVFSYLQSEPADCTVALLAFSVYQIYGLTYNQMTALCSSPAFIFPEMLPESRFIQDDSTEKQRRVLFSTAEDTYVDIELYIYGWYDHCGCDSWQFHM